MSIHLMSIVWEVEFPTPTQKLLMLRVADYADDEGGGIFPSIELLARQAGAKERQTQYALRALESAGLLSKIKTGGTGPKKTNTWNINVDLLIQLAFKELILKGKHDSLQAVENKGANIAPRTLARVQSAALRVQSATDKGATHCTQSTSNHHLEPTGASVRDETRSQPVEKGVPSFRLTPDGDRPQWNAWLDYLRGNNKDGLARAAEVAGEMTVTSKWPNPEVGLRGLLTPRREDNTARMLGEAVE